ncbi:GPAT2 acyltransferase, partial [Urocolius indicus]|nr:GPAT2 acyltransferase [Urocolius indicus]
LSPFPQLRMWLGDSTQKLQVFWPFLGKYRPAPRRCCSRCTPRSWDTFYHAQLHFLGLCDARRVTEEETWFRGWLARRVCGLLAVWGWKVPAD